jgi:ubiquitin C-terminal hydrolase
MILLNNYYKGFNNIGNTCYLNAGLQMIIQNKDLCYNILSSNLNNKFIKNLKEFIIEYYNNETESVLTPRFIKHKVSELNSNFIGFAQNDSSEFIIYFLDTINNLVSIESLYQMKSLVSIKCKLLDCLHISAHLENINYLILDINESNNLDDCYKKYKSKITMYDYKCDYCKEYTKISKRLKIISKPTHLIIILKRFNDEYTKNNNEINIPLIWRHNYILSGFIYHSGSPSGGHYIYIGNHNNNWLLFNDSSVTSIENIDKYKNLGYIYYYKLVSSL